MTLKNHTEREDTLVEDIFKAELPTPKSLGERSIRVRVRDGAQKILVSTITVGIPILIDLSSLRSRS